MKALRIILLSVGIIWFNYAFCYTLVNLPDDQIFENPIDNLMVFNGHKPVVVKPVENNTQGKVMYYDDTVVIDLAEVVVESRFPNASRDCITQQIPYPEFAVEQKLEGAVAVRFTFDNSGNVTIREASSNSPQLESYVADKLQNLKLKNCVVDVGRDYYLRFLFKLY